MKTLLYINILCLLTASLFAQDYYIKGTITDKKTSNRIKKAKISLYNSKDSLVTEVYSDRKGRYLLRANVHENYYILVDKKEYSKIKYVDVPVGKSIDRGDLTLDKKTRDSHSHFFSMSGYKRYREYKKLSLKAEDLKAVQKDGKTSWTVKTTFTNRSRDTLFYFITPNCKAADFSVDTNALFVDFQKCDTEKLTVIAVKPRGQRTMNLEISAKKPLTTSMEFRIVLFFNKAKDINDSLANFFSKRTLIIFSNRIKT